MPNRPKHVQIIHDRVGTYQKDEVVEADKFGTDDEYQRLIDLGAIAPTDATHEVRIPADPLPTPHPAIHVAQPEPPAPSHPHPSIHPEQDAEPTKTSRSESEPKAPHHDDSKEHPHR